MKDHTRSRAAQGDVSSKIAIMLFSVFVFFALIMVCPIAVYAHAPKEVTLVFNTEAQTLEVTIVHEVSTTWHYINKVEIKKNGKSVSSNDYTSQPDKSKFVYSYKVQTVKGDVLEVTASCNIFGSKTVKLTVDK